MSQFVVRGVVEVQKGVVQVFEIQGDEFRRILGDCIETVRFEGIEGVGVGKRNG